jgi:hypothetical protein
VGRFLLLSVAGLSPAASVVVGMNTPAFSAPDWVTIANLTSALDCPGGCLVKVFVGQSQYVVTWVPGVVIDPKASLVAPQARLVPITKSKPTKGQNPPGDGPAET